MSLLGAPLSDPGAEVLLGGAQQVAEREAERANPEAVAERAASRTRYEGLDRASAVALATATFAINEPSWLPPGGAGEGHITNYIGKNSADLLSPLGKHILVESTVPLQSVVGSGQIAPTSLTLREHDGAFVPSNPVVPVAIAKTPSHGVSLPSGLSLAPVQAAAPEGPTVVGDRVVYPGTAVDTDFMAEPVPGGVETSWQLLSARSPQENGLRFNMPAGAQLRASKSVDGGVEVVDQGQTLDEISPATATEADGTTLPVSYTISGDTLESHVDLRGSVAFPVMIDPLVDALDGAFSGAEGSWNGWTFWTEYGSFTSWGNASLRGTGSPAGSYPAGEGAEWYIEAPGAGTEGGAAIARVDLRGVGHYQANESNLFAGMSGAAPKPSWTFNGTIPGDTQWGDYQSSAGLSGYSMAFCADGVEGGRDGGPPELPLCNESYGAEFFNFAINTIGKQSYENYVEMSGAAVLFLDNTAPNEVYLHNLPVGWVKHAPTNVYISGHDQGVGIKNFEIESPPEHTNEKGEPFWVSPAYCTEADGLTGCEQSKSSATLSLEAFNTKSEPHVLGVYAADAAKNVRQEEVGPSGEERHDEELKDAREFPTLYIDNEPPRLAAFGGSLAEAPGGKIGSGDYVLTFAAEDGSAAKPQSGVHTLTVSVDGSKVDEIVTSCPDPSGDPAESCYALSGSWTMEGQKYGAGVHTITVTATDWAGNESKKELVVTPYEAPYKSLGPGSVNLRSGAYRLEATDVAVAGAGADLTVARSYNSRQLTQGASGPLGPQWSLALPDVSAGGEWQSLRRTPSGSVDATTASGTVIAFAFTEGKGFTSPAGYQTLTLSESSKSPLEYEITNAAGDITVFKRANSSEEQEPLLIPGVVEQASGAGGLNKVTYTFATVEGITEPSEELAPYPSTIKCLSELVQGCRALEFKYATATSATGEGESQWGEYKGRLKEVKLVAWNGKEMTKTSVADYSYDATGRLRAEWNPQVEATTDCGKACPTLKTTYGYDTEGHVTALTAPGEESWAFTYGTIAGESSPGRVLKVAQAPAATALWKGEAPKNTTAPVLSGSAVIGSTMAVSRGTWSNEPVVYGYQWEDCNYKGLECTTILGATNPNYKVAPSDAGRAIVGVVTATNGGGSVAGTTTASTIVSTPSAEYALPTGSSPSGIVQGPDGNMWYVDGATNKIGKITASGTILAEYSLPTGSGAGTVAKGPDGNLWFTEYGTDKIGKITTSGTITEYSLPFGSGPEGIAQGADGNLWFTNYEDNKIGKIATSGTVLAEYSLPSGSDPEAITQGPDGNIWFIELGTNKIGKITTSGTITQYSLPSGSDPSGITQGPDGNLWYADNGTSKIGKITTSGTITEYLLPSGSGPAAIAQGPDGNLWYVDFGSSKIGKITTAGTITETALPSGSNPLRIAQGPDGDLWYSDYGTNKIGQIPTASTTITSEGERRGPEPGATVEYDVPLSVSGRQSMTKEEVAKWGQGTGEPAGDVPVEGAATAIFPPDEPEGQPAGDYRRATIYYLDSSYRTVNVATPAGGISTTEYESNDNISRTLSADNRAAALKEGSKSAEAAKPLYNVSKYNTEGTELLETLGPEHKVKLPNGFEAAARKQVKYVYNETGAPAGGPYRLATETTEDALTGGKEEDKRTVDQSYAGQEGLGWKLHRPTSTTTAPGGLNLVHSVLYSPTTGEATETASPGSAAKEAGIAYLRSFGSAGSESEKLVDPSSDAIDASGNVWVTDRGGDRVEEFSASGTFIKAFGGTGTGSGQFEEPLGIAINASTKNVYVADEDTNRISEFNEKGEFVRAFGYGVSNGESKLQTCTSTCRDGIAGSGAGQFNEPEGVAIDSSGNVWITDYQNNRVEEFGEKGEFIGAFGFGVLNGEAKLQTCMATCKAGLSGTASGEFDGPAYAAFSGGKLYVTDFVNDRVEEFNTSREYVAQFGAKGSGSGQFLSPGGIASGIGGNLYVDDTGNSRVEEFTASGAYVAQFGTSGTGAGQLKEPEGVAVAISGDIYVPDAGNNRVEEWVPGLSGNSGAYTSQIVYYSAKEEASVAACRNHPEWANLPCQTQPAHQPEVGGLPALPVTTVTYNIWDEPEVTKSTIGEGTEAPTRTVTQSYDPAGRPLSREVSSSTGTSLPKVSYTYNSETGALTKESTGSGSGEQKVVSEYNRVGALVAYTDATGKITSYEYEKEADERLLKVTDEKGYQTYGYSETTGELTSLKDSGAGTFTATYDAEGNLVSEGMPNGMTATTTLNPVGEATGLAYVKETHCSEKCTWLADEVKPSIHGQWMSQTSTLAKDEYAYNEVGWLGKVQETPVGKGCATRIYGYNADGDRTSVTKRAPLMGGGCAAEGGEVEEHAYDTADRLLDVGTSYNAFGDIVSLPGSDAGGSELRSTYYTDGQLASEEQAGETIGYPLDPAGRANEVISTGKATSTVTNNYDGPGDTPAWLAYGTGEWTRNIFGISGTLVATQNGTEAPILELSNLHGDIVATVSDSETATKLTSAVETTEYGVPTMAEPPKHSWLGASALRTELPSGVLDMGARSYVPELGRFLQPDPLGGGSGNAYSYTRGDPLNESDPSGEWSVGTSSGGASAIGEGTGVDLENGVGVAAGAIMPPPVSKELEEAYAAEIAAQAAAAAAAADAAEEYEYYEEEGEWEYISDHVGSESGKHEAGIEPALLYQPVEPSAHGPVDGALPLCSAESTGTCARDTSAKCDRGGRHLCHGNPSTGRGHPGGRGPGKLICDGIAAATGGKGCGVDNPSPPTGADEGEGGAFGDIGAGGEGGVPGGHRIP